MSNISDQKLLELALSSCPRFKWIKSDRESFILICRLATSICSMSVDRDDENWAETRSQERSDLIEAVQTWRSSVIERTMIPELMKQKKSDEIDTC